MSFNVYEVSDLSVTCRSESVCIERPPTNEDCDGIETAIDKTLSLFPFVCGLCYGKFNNVQSYYWHHRDYHKEAETYFHNHTANVNTDSHTDTGLYRCGKCSFISPSLCQLHEHLVNVEQVPAYKLFTDINTAYPCSGEDEVESQTSVNTGTDKSKAEKLENLEILDNEICKNSKKSDINASALHMVHTQSDNASDVAMSEFHKLGEGSNVSTDETGKNLSDQNESSKRDADKVVEEAEGILQSTSNKELVNCTGNNTSQGKMKNGSCLLSAKKTKGSCKVGKKKNTTYRRPLMKDSDGNPVYANKTYLTCEKCGLQIRRGRITNHMTTHSETREFPCDVCGFQFKNLLQLRQHRRTVHINENNFICKVCGKAFKNIPYLRQHEEIHEERDKSCPYCPQAFHTVKLLRRHMLVHKDEKQHSCEICGKEFTYKSGLTDHLRQVHSELRAHACRQCGKTFKLRHGLKKHMKTHGPPQHYCSVCGKGFHQLFNLKIHSNIHTKHNQIGVTT